MGAMPAGVAQRLAEIDKEIREVSAKYMAAKDDAERQAVSKRLMELQHEKAQMKGGDDEPYQNISDVRHDDLPPKRLRSPRRPCKQRLCALIPLDTSGVTLCYQSGARGESMC